MYSSWYEVFPEIEWISDEELRNKVIAIYDEAINIGNWTLEGFEKIPFTLSIPGLDLSYRAHVRAVTRMADQIYKEYIESYGEGYSINYDVLIAGALLHDVGKVIEFENDGKEKAIKGLKGKLLRHPFTGAGLAIKHGLSFEIAHIIAVHAKEGDDGYRSPEAVIIHHIDMLNYTSFKSHYGML